MLNQSLRLNKKTFKAILFISLILVLALILRMYQLDVEGYWRDELYSIRDAHALGEKTRAVPYFAILKIWMKFSYDEAWLRIISVFFGVLSVFLTYLLGDRLFDHPTGLGAAILISLSPLAINHSQEVRMYMMGLALATAGTIALIDWIDTKRNELFAGWVCLRFLAIWTTPLAALLFLADILVFVTFDKKALTNLLYNKRSTFFYINSLILFLVSGILVWIRFVPSMANFIAINQGLDNAEVSLTLISFVGMIVRFVVWPLNVSYSYLLSFHEHFLNLFAVITLFALFNGFIVLNTSNKRKIWTIAWGLIPLSILFIVCILMSTQHLWGIPRYGLMSAPYIYVLLSAGFIRIRDWNRQVALVLLLFYLVGVTSSLQYYYDADLKNNWREAIETINNKGKQDDAIIVPFAFDDTQLAMNVYYKGKGKIYSINSLEKLNEASNKDEKALTLNLRSELQQELENGFSKNSRIWVFLFMEAGNSRERELRRSVLNFLEEKFNIISHNSFKGIELLWIKI